MATFWAAMNWRRNQAQSRSRTVAGLDLTQFPDDDPPPNEQADRAWDAECLQEDARQRRAVIDRAWRRMEEDEKKRGGTDYHTLLQLKAEAPVGATAEQLADAFFTRTGQEVAKDTVRVWLLRAREKFATLLLEEIQPLLPPDLADELVHRETARELLHDLRLLGFFSDPPVPPPVDPSGNPTGGKDE
jgi:hypothetical protein